MAESAVRIEEQVAKVADRLASEYADQVPDVVVRQMVEAAYTPYRAARVTQFVPALVARSVRERLRVARG